MTEINRRLVGASIEHLECWRENEIKSAVCEIVLVRSLLLLTKESVRGEGRGEREYIASIPAHTDTKFELARSTTENETPFNIHDDWMRGHSI